MNPEIGGGLKGYHNRGRHNEDKRKEMDVVCMTDELRKIRLRWFGHIEHREDENVIQKPWRLLQTQLGAASNIEGCCKAGHGGG